MPVGSPLNRKTFRQRTGLDEGGLSLVSSSPFFSGISPDRLLGILKDAAVQEFPKNAILFLQGDPGVRFYLVLAGWVKVFRQMPDGREAVLHVSGVGESFAESAIFETSGHLAGASACADIRVLGVPTASFKKHLFTDGDLRERFMTTLSQKLLLVSQQYEELSTRSTAERLARYLLSLCPSGTETAIVRLPLEKTVIAASLGMQPETFSRTMVKLRAVGVSMERQTVSIADARKLRDLAEGGSCGRVGARHGATPQDLMFD